MTLRVPDALGKEHDETVRLIAAKLYEAGKLSFLVPAGSLAEDPAIHKYFQGQPAGAWPPGVTQEDSRPSLTGNEPFLP